MRTLKLTIAYDGTRYAGWQVQRQGRTAGRPTIQETLERVLGRILQERVAVTASGRTDAGVHALAQVAHIKVRNPMPAERLLRSVNQLLPADVAVLRIEPAPAGFHARFQARSKRYRYRIFLGPAVPPFDRLYVWHVRMPLNLALMRREAAGLAGRHNFKAFAIARPHGTTVRTITRVSLARRGEELWIEIEGDGFLHTMVRSIAGTLVDAGRGRLPAGTIRRMLARGDRALAGATAPAQGLALVSVTYRGR